MEGWLSAKPYLEATSARAECEFARARPVIIEKASCFDGDLATMY